MDFLIVSFFSFWGLLILLLISFLALFPLIISLLVYKDAVKQDMDMPLLWAILNFFTFPWGLALYIVVRILKEEQK